MRSRRGRSCRGRDGKLFQAVAQDALDGLVGRVVKVERSPAGGFEALVVELAAQLEQPPHGGQTVKYGVGEQRAHYLRGRFSDIGCGGQAHISIQE